MAFKVFKEPFSGQYDGVVSPLLLPPGFIRDGKNVRKASQAGGWKPRRGCALLNTTAEESGTAFASLHDYTHPRNKDRHLIGQINSLLLSSPTSTFYLLLESDDRILMESGGSLLGQSGVGVLTQRADFGNTMGLSVGATPGFSAMVNEDFVYADGSSAPITFGGTMPFCIGFLAYDDSVGVYNDYTTETTDDLTTTYATLGSAANDYVYVCSPEIADGIVFTLGSTVNNNAATVTVSSWVAAAWADRSAADGTADGGASLAKSGTMSWTRNATDTMSVINGVMGYWYRVSFSAAIDAVTVTKCRVTRDATTITNKWDGAWESPTGILFYDQSDPEYEDKLSVLTDGSATTTCVLDSSTTSDYLYIKTPEPACGFWFGMAYFNTDNAQVDLIEYWTGSAWTTVGTLQDYTLDSAADSSFSKNGAMFFDGSSISPQLLSEFENDNVPGYWYRVSWDAALDAECEMYSVLYAQQPKDLPTYQGVVEYRGRAVYWGDPEHPNRLRISAKGRADICSGSDACYSDPLGGMDAIKCAVKYYDDLLVLKDGMLGLFTGTSPANFEMTPFIHGLGLCSPQSVQAISNDFPSQGRDDPLSVVLWQDSDGIYALDGQKPRKVSLPVDHYFNPEYSTVISASHIGESQSFLDRRNGEYHLLCHENDLELVYNYITGEWYPPWYRSMGLQCAVSLKDDEQRHGVYGGSGTGFVMELETDTTDKNASNADVAIEHYVTTRAIGAHEQVSNVYDFKLGKIFPSFKAQSSGNVTMTLYPDTISVGTSLGTVSLVRSGYETTTPSADRVDTRMGNFSVKFSSETADVKMELYAFLYELDIYGELSN